MHREARTAREARSSPGPAPRNADVEDPGLRTDVVNELAQILTRSGTGEHSDAGGPLSQWSPTFLGPGTSAPMRNECLVV